MKIAPLKEVPARIYYWIKIVWLASKWPNQLNLGDHVLYNGKQYVLIQGVSSPFWDLVPCVKQEGYNPEERLKVHQDNFTKVRSLTLDWKAFSFGYNFYMTSWFRIWVNSGIEPWMRGCSIWPKGVDPRKQK